MNMEKNYVGPWARVEYIYAHGFGQ